VPAEINQSIGRAAAVLSALGESKTGSMRASDIARAIGLGASTTSRLLGTLEELGYVRKESDGLSYHIGMAIVALSSLALNQNPVHRESRVAAQDLAQRTGLSVNVAVPDGAGLVYLCHFEGPLAPKAHTMVGMSQPMHGSALGKCLMLDMTEDQRIALLGPTLPSYTANTIASHQQLTSDLRESAKLGRCTEIEELALGRLCVAAPIRDSSGTIVAAISVSGRLSVMRSHDVDALSEEVIEVADRVSIGLGLITAIPALKR
jgi:IclR family acetate operon transcriptional repressor